MEIPRFLVFTGNIVDHVFGTERISNLNSAEITKKIILTTKNKFAIEINNELLKLLDGPETNYKSIDTVISEDINDAINYPTEFLNQQWPSGIPPHEIKLKVGGLIMLLRNLNPKKGLLNGTRLKVTKLELFVIEGKIISGSNIGRKVIILRSSDPNFPVKMKRRQFSILPAFAMTINKSQGQSFESVGVYLPEEIFAHGKLYVALTRCKFSNKLKVFLNPMDEIYIY